MIEGPLLPLLALVTPLALGLLAVLPAVRARALWLLPVAPLPALALALAGPAEPVTFTPDLLLGASLGLDPRRALFLGFAAALWSAAGAFAVASMRGTARPAVFTGFWCLTLAGNLGVFLALDVATFYVSFAAVSLAAYVLVVHDGTAKALRAGRIYLALAVLGETCLLAGFLIALSESPSLGIADMQIALAVSPLRDIVVALLVAGFGLKAGLMPLHVWLPLAHPAAPTPASAALSGAIVKAGIFGLIAFLPPGIVGWGEALVAAGLASAYLAVLLGLAQKDAKAVLAYSTISQMGLVIAVLGAGAASFDPRAADVAAFYSLHHGLAKAALFLSVGVAAAAGGGSARALLAATALVALSVAGLPGTGGAAAKAALKAAMAPDWAVLAVTLSGAGTALLLGRFLLLLGAKTPPEALRPGAGLALPALALALGALVVPWLLLPDATGLARVYPFGGAALIDALWPLAVALLIGLGLMRLRPRPPAIPEGDLAVPLERAAGRIAAAARRLPEPPAPAALHVDPRLRRLAQRAETSLGRWPAAGAILVILALAFALGAATAR